MSELRELARLADARSPSRSAPDSRRVAVLAFGVLILSLPALLVAGLLDSWRLGEAGGAQDMRESGAQAAPALAPEAQLQAGAPAAVPPFARFEDLELALPAAEVRLVAFHEAAFDDALALEPMGRVSENLNTTKFTAGPATAGPEFVILSSRGRPTPATSAVDVMVDPGVAVASPVDGTVVDVEEYWLYGRHRDVRLEIIPEARPDLRVVIIHLSDVRVTVGARLVAGETVLAGSATTFPFQSQVDRHVDPPAGPHVHIEVKRG